jgi:hypothetical protein
MKIRDLFASASVVLGLASLACSSGHDDIVMGSDSGGSSAGTKGQGGFGDKANGGSSSGGSSSGGSASSGGKASGGEASGGLSTVGGEASGGSLTIGGKPSGGSAGAPSTTCDQNTDCVMCAYPTAPVNAQECYCINYCGPTPMSKAECSANQAQFDKICANVHLPCPANLIQCLPPPEPVCTSHMCVAK